MSAAPAAALKRVRAAVAADQDPARGSDLLRLLKPVTTGQAKKAVMTSEAYSIFPEPSKVMKVSNRSQALPEGIQLAISGAECDSMMGLFPEIGRAWVVVDNILFLWNYDRTGNAYESYTSPDSQLIVSVGLCRPKPGFESLPSSFTAKPDYVLVITTIVNVTLLRLDKRGDGEWSISETSINASTDGVLMRDVQGTSEGRIFMAGEDGSVHEFVYETKRNFLHTLGVKRQCFTLDRSRSGVSAALSWLVPPAVQKIYTSLVSSSDPLVHLEVDDGRKLLYSVSKHGVVGLYNFQKPDEVVHISSFDCGHLERALEMRVISGSMVGVKDVDLKNFEICSVDIISASTSSVHLVVVSRTGIRIFFTTYESVSAAATSSQTHGRIAGKRLNPISIRGPPEPTKLGEARTSRSTLLSNEKGMYVPAGMNSQLVVARSFSTGDVTFVAFDAVFKRNGEGSEAPLLDVMGFSLDFTSASSAKWELDMHREQLDDRIFGMGTEGRVHAMKELLQSPSSFKMRQHWTGGAERVEDAVGLTELVTQFGPFDKRRFLVLTSQGMRMIERNRPIDVLSLLLEGSKTTSEQIVPQFFRRFGLDESCAMALALACSAPFSSEKNMFIQDWAQINTAAKASYFLSLLGFTAPPSSTTDIEFKLPSFKSLKEQEAKKSQASTALVPVATRPGMVPGNGYVNTQMMVVPLSSSSLSVQRAVLAQVGAPSARDAANKSIEDVETDVLFSGCFEGLVLYTSRLLRPIWQWSIITKQEFRWSVVELEQIKVPLVRLAEFMERHHPFSQAIANKSKTRSKQVQFTPSLVEDIRVGETYSLIRRVVDAINFFIEMQRGDRKYLKYFRWVLADNADEIAVVEKITWEDFITTDAGLRLSRVFVRALLDKEPKLKDGPFLTRLSQTCGDFFSKNYFGHVMAMDEFQQAEKDGNNREWQVQHVAKAISLLDSTFKTSLASDQQKDEALERLQEACERCEALNEHWRAIQLISSLTKHACDASGVEVNALPQPKTFEDQSSLPRFRIKCYIMAWDVLTHAQTVSNETFNRALEVALLGQDAMFQFLLFMKMLDAKKMQLLVDCTPASFIEVFLKNGDFNTYMRGAHTNAHLVLYAKWLARHDRMAEAAPILRGLAELDEADEKSNPSVQTRLDYLNEAIVYDGERSSSLRKRLNIVRSTIDLRQSLLGVVGEKAPIIAELTYRPMKESRLFELAQEYQRWEDCLHLLQQFGRDQDKAEHVNDIYGEMLAPLLEQWNALAIASIMERLARQFAQDPLIFPLNELVDNLEMAVLERYTKLRSKRDLDEAWLVNALIQGGVPFSKLFVAYARFVAGFDQPRDPKAIAACRLFIRVTTLWMKRQPDDLKTYADHAIGSSLDLGSVMSVLRKLQRRFAGETEVQHDLDELARHIVKL